MERAWGLPGTIMAGVCPVLGRVVDKVAIDAAIYRMRTLSHRCTLRLRPRLVIEVGDALRTTVLNYFPLI